MLHNINLIFTGTSINLQIRKTNLKLCTSKFKVCSDKRFLCYIILHNINIIVTGTSCNLQITVMAEMQDKISKLKGGEDIITKI